MFSLHSVSGNSHAASAEAYDVVVVGAGFAGMYMLHRLRGQGVSVRVYEQGGDVGGTWYWNRYPGARCDVESMQYSYSFSEELQQEWNWSERYAPQPEILKYANHVADRFDLRSDIQLNTRVDRAAFDETTRLWSVTTSDGNNVTAKYVVLATGCLSNARMPDIKGLPDFKGKVYHTGHWPREPVDFAGQRVGVIGTGSSAIQSVPIIAEQASQLTVFQRTPNFSIPARNALLTSEEREAFRAKYPEVRRFAREEARNGIYTEMPDRGALDDSDNERRGKYQARWERGGLTFMSVYNNLGVDKAANDTAADFVREKIAEIVRDPETAKRLPGSPSVLSNMIVSIEQHVDWIADCIGYMRAHGLDTMEAEPDAEDKWVAHVNEVAQTTLYPQANSWYMGANIPGKPQIFMPYIGGVGVYRQICNDVAAKGYEGFAMTSAEPAQKRAAS
jgi:cyclohexanone monooxygenase